jgi:predicted ATPase/DNA-binding CsgD family transcriptional regulator
VRVDRVVSAREAEVLSLLGEHLTHAEIAARLYLSIRTVESHVASLRRKLDLPAHRDLVRFAAARREVPRPVAAMPLSSFVGRARERIDVADAVRAGRLVSLIGPGGAGKTRLAAAVADDLMDEFSRVWHVDLVPVPDGSSLAATVAVACGVADVPGRSVEDALVRGLGEQSALLVLDNCEHLVNAVAVLVDLLASSCPRLHVIVTSRARLVLPFERVVPLAGLSDEDALALFVERAVAAGWDDPTGEQRARMSAICAAVDGLALAIELAAVRLPSLGLGGLERGLADQTSLLVGGPRQVPRHRSMHDTLLWSYQLLQPAERAVLCRVAVFAAGFDAWSARAVVGYGDIEAENVADLVARLVDQSLLVSVPGGGDRRWRALEPVRQFAFGQMNDADREAYGTHERWVRHRAETVRVASVGPGRGWHGDFDAIVDEMRAALGWLAGQPDRGRDAADFAHLLATLLFRSGRAREAQLRYEQAAALAPEPGDAARRLSDAADVARCRVLGEEALRLDLSAVAALRADGDHDALALGLARAAETILRFEGMFAASIPITLADELLDEVSRLSPDPAALTAAHVIALSRADPTNPRIVPAAERAADAARAHNAPVRESAAMDTLTAAYIMSGRPAEARRCAQRRVATLVGRPIDPGIALELKDALHMAVLSCVGAGDLSTASQYAVQHRMLGFLREQGDLAVEATLTPDALAGRWHAALAGAELFLEDWIAAGKPPAAGRAVGPCAVAMVYGVLGREADRSDWLDVVAQLRGVPRAQATDTAGFGDVFDAIVFLHHDDAEHAVAVLTAGLAAGWYERLLHQWRAALLAEAAVLTGAADASERLRAARSTCVGNPVASAIVDRAEVVQRHDVDALADLASRFTAIGAAYQAGRTLLLAGPAHRTAGNAILAGLTEVNTDGHA